MKTLRITALKLLVRTLGQLSDGLSIACRDGLTSGRMVDYVYRNQPAGKWLVGKVLDRMYLSNDGWEAIRLRRRHLVRALTQAVRQQLTQCREVFLLDVACGYADYLLDVLMRFRRQPVRALCWDVNEACLAEARSRAAHRGLTNVAFDRTDSLRELSFHGLPGRPNIVIASGFYDWVRQDDQIRASMALVWKFLRPGGHFLFTAQTGHGDLELVNALFPGNDGKALVLQRNIGSSRGILCVDNSF